MRFRTDDGVRRFGTDGRVVLGGDPVALMRLSTTGAAVLDRLLAGGSPETATEVGLLRRLVDRGIVVPEPTPGAEPYGTDDVTVVVPVRDDADGVGRLLGSLAAAGDALAEVIVVDDGSVEPAALVAAVATERPGVTARLVRRDRSGGPAAARNDGAAQVHSPVIAFLDADCTVAPGWLDPLLGHFEDEAVAVVAPRVVAVPSTHPGAGSTGVWGVDELRSPLDLGVRPALVAPGRRVSYVPSAAMLVRTDVLDDVGAFDVSLRVGEDVDLIWRVVGSGRVVRYEPAARVSHEVRPDLRSFLRQRVAYGSSAALLDERHPGWVSPARLSRWSAVVAAGLLVGGPGVPAAAALVAWTSWSLRGQLDGVPTRDVLRVGVGGHWSAVRQLLRSSLRVWWPLLVAAVPWSRRARRVLSAALALAVAEALREGVRPVHTPLAVLDDMSYGAGVWLGCARRRSLGALLPDLVDRRRRRDS